METKGDLGILSPEFLDQLPVARVQVSSLVPGSARLSGVDTEHARVLAEAKESLPPIVVHRVTMRVIDGMHRLRVAVSRGEKVIEARLFDGAEADAFVLAVRSNITHGLPLSLADRKAAAARITASHPHWSDRVIASAAGLSAKTVAAIRRRPAPGRECDAGECDIRVGHDGRSRAVNGAHGRRLAAQVIAANPGASLREIARQANISPETARDVRARLRRGESPVLPSRSAGRESPNGTAHGSPNGVPNGTAHGSPNGAAHGQSGKSDQPGLSDLPAVRKVSALRSLMADPALRSTESGRALLRLLDSGRIIEEHGRHLMDEIPAHCRARVAEAARACVRAWQSFEAELMAPRSG